MRDDIEAVVAANREFYRAFADQDIDAMIALWSKTVPVACIHPGWDALLDYESVVASWREIMGNPSSPNIECRNETPFVFGHMAFVVCHEVLDQGLLAATNVFHREDDGWKIIHHQASPLAVEPAEEPSRGSGRVH